MEAEAKNDAPDSPARTVLLKQAQLIDADLRHRRLQIAGEWMSNLLKVGIGLAGLAVAIALSLMAWNASRANGLVIKPFSVPPALAARGITGDALAGAFMDRISLMKEKARDSKEAAKQISADTGEHVSIQIPETGISLAQLDQWLRDKLGHERQIAGELMAGPGGGLTLAVRAGPTAFPAQSGPEADLSAMLQRAAEAIYKREQPEGYDRFLFQEHRFDDRLAFARERTTSHSRVEQAAGFAMLGDAAPQGLLQAAADYRRAIAIDPVAVGYAYSNLANIETQLGHPDAALALRRRYRTLLRQPGAFPTLSAEARRQQQLYADHNLAKGQHDHVLALELARQLSRVELLGFVAAASFDFDAADAQVALHDVPGARATQTAFAPRNEAQRARRQAVLANLGATQDPNATLALLEAAETTWAKEPDAAITHARDRATRAYILATFGRMEEARALIDTTPLDCANCVFGRARIAELAGDHRLADHWFGQYQRMTPSLAEPPMYWGNALLARGEAARAAAQYEIACQRSPHWADPLSRWGEALLKQGKAKAAIAKFRQAEKYAPKWGLNHLLWGEALARLGKRAESRAQFTLAAGLDLTAAERARLTALQGDKP